MKLHFNILIVLIFAILASCNSSKKVSAVDDNIIDVCESMTFSDQFFDKVPSDYYSLDTMFLVDNCLVIWVSYSGGCGDANFKLLYSDKIIKTTPPRINLMLQLSDDDDCRAIVQQKLFYDVSFFEDYAEETGINLRLTGIGNTVFYKK